MKTIKITEEVHNLLLQEKAKRKFKTLSDTIKYWWCLADWQNQRMINEQVRLKAKAIDEGLNKIDEIKVVFGVTKNDKSEK